MISISFWFTLRPGGLSLQNSTRRGSLRKRAWNEQVKDTSVRSGSSSCWCKSKAKVLMPMLWRLRWLQKVLWQCPLLPIGAGTRVVFSVVLALTTIAALIMLLWLSVMIRIIG